jgi:hypothetical protein
MAEDSFSILFFKIEKHKHTKQSGMGDCGNFEKNERVRAGNELAKWKERKKRRSNKNFCNGRKSQLTGNEEAK